MPWALRGLREGILTTGYPKKPDVYAETFPATVRPTHTSNTIQPPSAAPLDERVCPTSAIEHRGGGLRVDTGRCILCGRCIREHPHLFEWAPGAETSSPVRDALLVPHLAETEETLKQVRRQLAARTRLLRRSVHVRHIDLGSDGSEEWEVLALLNPVYDVHRLGIFFTASPRHADVLLATGAGAHGMVEPLRRTVEAMPRPLVVIAAGVDAISGGLLTPSYAVAGGIGGLVEVDVWVPGSPPSPFSLLHALLLATGRLEAKAG
jgi:Ni,Fe-hydrogenase III small subunit/ferredoxin